MERNLMKKKLLFIGLILIIFSVLSAGTIAYFTADSTAHNIIGSGNVRIEVEEWTDKLDSEGKTLPFENIDGVMPGAEVSKIVQVKNIGDGEAFIRLKLGKAIELAEGMEGEVDLDLITMDFNKDKWIEKGGYYYYKEPLLPGDKTEPLFTKVRFAKSMGNLYQNSSAIVDVKAFGVQAANNGPGVFDAAGWAVE